VVRVVVVVGVVVVAAGVGVKFGLRALQASQNCCQPSFLNVHEGQFQPSCVVVVVVAVDDADADEEADAVDDADVEEAAAGRAVVVARAVVAVVFVDEGAGVLAKVACGFMN